MTHIRVEAESSAGSTTSTASKTNDHNHLRGGLALHAYSTKRKNTMYNIKSKTVIGLIILFSFELVAQASTPVSRAVIASKDRAERIQARVIGELAMFGDTAKSPLSATRGRREGRRLAS